MTISVVTGDQLTIRERYVSDKRQYENALSLVEKAESDGDAGKIEFYKEYLRISKNRYKETLTMAGISYVDAGVITPEEEQADLELMAVMQASGYVPTVTSSTQATYLQITPTPEERNQPESTVGEFFTDSGIKVKVTSNSDQSSTKIIDDETGQEVYNGMTNEGGGVVANLPANYRETEAAAFAAAEKWQLSNDDLIVAQGILETGVVGGNLKKSTYGTGIPSQPPEGSFGISDKGKEQAKLNKEEYYNKLPELKFGAVDHILQRLSLRNLTYPLDADYGNTQDYMMINQFTYRPPNKDLIFPSGTRPGFKNAVDSFVTGVPQGTPKEKAIGLVKLPMPNTLEDSNNVSWGEDKLNALTAAATSAAMGASAETLPGIIDFFATMGQRGMGENVNEALRRIQSAAGEMGSDIGNAASGFKMNENVRLLGRTLVGSTLLNALQFEVSPETILARGAGVVPNNNLALLFNSPTLREFKFSWKMSPRSKEEAIRINNILRFFKQGMAPKKGITSNSRSGGGSYFLGTPNIFDLSFKTARTKNSFWEILDRNDSVMRIKTCACTGAAVNYTPEGMWNAYEKGQPVAITLTLRFNELEPIFDTDYDDNYFNYDPQRTDLLPVPMDAVGY